MRLILFLVVVGCRQGRCITYIATGVKSRQGDRIKQFDKVCPDKQSSFATFYIPNDLFCQVSPTKFYFSIIMGS